jgi:hypothetical protein
MVIDDANIDGLIINGVRIDELLDALPDKDGDSDGG